MAFATKFNVELVPYDDVDAPDEDNVALVVPRRMSVSKAFTFIGVLGGMSGEQGGFRVVLAGQTGDESLLVTPSMFEIVDSLGLMGRASLTEHAYDGVSTFGIDLGELTYDKLSAVVRDFYSSFAGVSFVPPSMHTLRRTVVFLHTKVGAPEDDESSQASVSSASSETPPKRRKKRKE